MSEEKKSFRVGDEVPEDGNYYCEICHTEGGVTGRKLSKGEPFPVCMNCGDSTSWTKAPGSNRDE